MHATAQALVRASVLAKDPLASPVDLRRAQFLRFYGAEFRALARERILTWLGEADLSSLENPAAVRAITEAS